MHATTTHDNDSPENGFFAENVAHFARALRRAGVPVGPDRVLDALRALQATGISRRDDFYWTLAALFLNRHEHFDVFDQAFNLFWRNRQLLEQRPPALPRTQSAENSDDEVPGLRVAEALGLIHESPLLKETESDETGTAASHTEQLRRKDFDSMTNAELAQAKQLIAGLRLPIAKIRTRRLLPSPHGRFIDMRTTLRSSLRGNADVIPLARRAFQQRHPPLVVLCDISGSMSRYSRMFLHFLHAVTNDRDRVHTFVFGTRLSNITRHLRHRDVDIALGEVSRAVGDWSGGTRIGATISEFNLRWSRRVLGQNAVVLLISDGLDRDGGANLGESMERLRKSCRQLIWLNPLLRFDKFEPLATGVRIMLPHVDAFLPAHNVDSLVELTAALKRAHQAPVRSILPANAA
jgi:uncharacterized protein with von Willebrand factor type A (vWA) domain